MKILFNKTSQVFENNLTICEVGLIFSLLYVRDKEPKMFLAKAKATIPFKSYKKELVHLHELKLISWSGYNNAKKALSETETNPVVLEIIDFINTIWKRRFSKAETNQKPIKNRLLTHSVDDIKKVVSNRYAVWKDDKVMSKHLNIKTVFRNSLFEGYLEEALRTKEGASIVNASSIDLKKGDEITFSLSLQLIDNDVYNVRIYSLSDENRIGTGVSKTMFGKDIKKSLKGMKILRNKEYEYIFEGF